MSNDRAALLAEAYSRGILPPAQKAAYEEAISRGLVSAPAKDTSFGHEATAVTGGINRGVANALGAPVDIVNSGLKWAQGKGTDADKGPDLIPGLGAVLGPLARLLPDASATPVGGSEWWKNRQGDVIDVGNAAIGNGDAPSGRELVDTQANTRLGRIGARVGEELGSAAVPMGVGMALPKMAGPVAETVRESLAGVNTKDRLAQLLMSGGSGVGAGVAKEVAPDSQLAELAGALLGGGVTAGGLYAGGTTANVVAPFLSQGAREKAAGAVIRQSYTAPEDYAKYLIEQGIDPKVAARQAEAMKQQALDADLANAPTEVVPGSKLTSAMATQNPGLASLERTVRATNGADFALADAARAEAQRTQIQGQAPQGPGADAVQDMARAEQAAIEQQGAARVANAQQRLDTASGDLGQGADPLVAGRTIRGELSGARGIAKSNESALWQGLEKNPDLALSIQSGRESAQRMIGEIGPYAAPPQGDVGAILQAAANLPETIRYADLQQLRSRALQEARNLKTAGNAVDLRRIEAVVSGLDEDIARAAGGGEVPAPAMLDVTPAPVSGPQQLPPNAPQAPIEALPAPVAAESAPNPQTSPTIVPDGLTPNFGPEEAAAYQAARQATAQRKGTFDSGAPGAVLKKVGNGGRDGEFAMPAEQVAGRLFNSGKASNADVAEFLKAAGSRPAAVQALQDFAVADLRRVATNADGTINPTKWRNWMDAHAAALRPFPELAAKMKTVAMANDLVKLAGDEAVDAVAAFGKSAGGTMLAKDADVAIASVLGSGNRTEGLAQLVKLAKGDPEKLGQLRRAVVDHFQQAIESNAVDASGKSVLSHDKTSKFLDKHAKAMERSGLFSADHIKALRQVEEDMARMTYVNTVGRAVGSNTFQNFSAGAVINQALLGAGLPEAIRPLVETIMRPVSWAYQVPDREVRRLILEAVADPKVMRVLAGKATPDRMNWVGQMLKRRLAATSVEGGAQTLPDEERKAS
jgi:hypothetical protein